MPWKTESVMDQRVEFVLRAKEGEEAICGLVSRVWNQPADRIFMVEPLSRSGQCKRVGGGFAAAVEVTTRDE
jgi:hypothetical protein